MNGEETESLLALATAAVTGTPSWRERSAEWYVVGLLHGEGPKTEDEIRAHLSPALAATLEPQSFEVWMAAAGAEAGESGAWALTPKKKTEISGAIAAGEALDRMAGEQFDEVRLSVDPSGQLPLDWVRFLDAYLLPLVEEYGARTLDLLAGRRHTDLDDRIVERFLKQFQAVDELAVRAVCARALGATEGSTILEVVNRLWLSKIYSSFGRLSRDQLDHVAAAFDSEHVFRFVCDTNFLFSLAGLHQNPSNHSSQNLHALTGPRSALVGARVEFFWLQATLEEAVRTLKAAGASWDFAVTPVYATEALKLDDQYGLNKQFLMSVAAGTSTINGREYFEYQADALVARLQALGLTGAPVNEGALRASPQLERRLNRLRSANRRKTYQKDDRLLVHDAMLTSAAGEMRVSSASSSPTDWVVTEDVTLIGDDLTSADGDSDRVCLLASDARSIVDLWLPQDLKREGLAAALSLPIVGLDFDSSAERATREILRHLAMVSNLDGDDPRLAHKILTNQNIRLRMSDEKGSGALLEEIELAVASDADAYREEAAARQRDVEELQAKVEALAAAAASSEEEKERLKAQYDSVRQRLNKLQDEEKRRGTAKSRKKAKRAERSKLADVEAELNDLREWERFRTKVLWPGIGLAGIGIGGSLGLGRALDWPVSWILLISASVAFFVLLSWWADALPDVSRSRRSLLWRWLLTSKGTARFVAFSQLVSVVIAFALSRAFG